MDDVTGRRTSRAQARRQQGFTLLEILVVVVIIAIVASLATLAIRDDPEQRVRTEVERFGALVTLAGQEAVLQSREAAVEFETDGYHFLFFEDDAWTEAKDDMFRARKLPPDMELHVTIDGQRIDFGDDQEKGKRHDPRIYLLSGGEMTPFELTVRNTAGTASYRVQGDFGGKLAYGS